MFSTPCCIEKIGENTDLGLLLLKISAEYRVCTLLYKFAYRWAQNELTHLEDKSKSKPALCDWGSIPNTPEVSSLKFISRMAEIPSSSPSSG